MEEPELADIALAADRLAEQLAACHDAVMAVFKFAGEHPDTAVQLDAMKTAPRMMQANAAAATAIKRLKDGESRHTFTYVHQE